MKQWIFFFHAVFHQSNKEISVQSVLLSLNHTHPIQPEIRIEMVMKVPRANLLK
jgi:hypothetical protein|tara:strand:+ start:1195 stop:1356 length:162 start_codon:yes stop_codon:yes gene_type:complete